MKPIIVSCDPGKNGGLGVCFPNGTHVSHPMPETEGDLLELLEVIRCQANLEGFTVTFFLENLVKFAGRKQTGAGMATYASNWGLIKGIVMAFRWRLELITPQKWQKGLGLGSKGELSDTEWKNKGKAMAQRLYPDQKVTHATADALLILEWARRQTV